MGRKPRQAIYKNGQHRPSMILTTLVVLMLLLVVAVGSYNMRLRLAEFQAREAELVEMISAEHERAREIEAQARFTQTMKYVEEVARKRLGLVYPGEQIFRRN
ncbi:MAG: septum formation initiator family protein [Lachnospiraceae bacterium]|jgi:cell division protein FtsB|nr:septum formation initiator family protein [Lachnospiraceae bacterium]